MPSPITIRDLRDDERAWADAQYRAIQFAVTPAATVALVAALPELADRRVGLGRLVAHGGALELGGIWTDEAVRGRGVARAMVAALIVRAERVRSAEPLWCIPFAHLAAFYESSGFVRRAPPWPAAIADKVAGIIAQGLPGVVVLAR